MSSASWQNVYDMQGTLAMCTAGSDSQALLQACSEGSLFRACMTWADDTDRDCDEVEQLLPFIRFPLMTQQELQVTA